MKPKRTKADFIWGSPALDFNLSNSSVFRLRHFNDSVIAERLLHPGKFFGCDFFSWPNDTNALYFKRAKRLKKQTWRWRQYPEILKVLFNPG